MKIENDEDDRMEFLSPSKVISKAHAILPSQADTASRDDMEFSWFAESHEARETSRKNNLSTESLEKIHVTTLTRECDYDLNPTELFKSIEAKQFQSALSLFTASSSEILKETLEQANTWITRRDTNGKLRWRMLPLHAAIIFRAPLELVQALISVSPNSIQREDDRGQLPLHLAFRNLSEENIITTLLKVYPESLHRKDRKGRVPLQCASKGNFKLLELYSETMVASDVVRQTKSGSDNLTKNQMTSTVPNKKENENQILFLKETIKDLQDSLNDKEMMYIIAKKRVAYLEDRTEIIPILEEKVKKLNEKAVIAEQKHASSLERVVSLGVNKKILSLEEKVHKLNGEIISLQKENEIIPSLHNTISNLKTELRFQEGGYVAALKKTDSLEDENRMLREENEKMVLLEEENKAVLEQLQKENEAKKELNDRLCTKEDEYKEKIQKLDDELKSKEEVLEQLQKENEAQKELNDSLCTKEEYENAVNDLDSMRKANKSLRKTMKEMMESNSELAKNSEIWKEKAGSLRVDIENLKNFNTHLQSSKKELEVKVKELELQVEDLLHLVEDQKEMLSKARSGLEEVTLKVKKQQEDIASYKNARQKMMQAFFSQEEQAEAVVEEEMDIIQNFSFGVLNDVKKTLENPPHTSQLNAIDE